MDWMAELWNWFKDSDPTPNPDINIIPEFEKKLLELHNSKRENSHFLVINDKLTKAASKHAQWMAKNNRMSHMQGLKSVSDRVKEENYNWNYVGENIAMGYNDTNSVFKGWMFSIGHRMNILNKNYKEVGFGLAKSTNDTNYWCVVFGRH